MVDYQTISIVLTGIGLMIALTYYALQIRNQNRTRQAQLFMQIYNQFTNREFNKTLFHVYTFEIKNYEDFEHHNQIMSEFYTSFFSVAAFFEGVGILVKRKLINPVLIDDVMSGPLLYFWSKYAELVKEWRTPKKNPDHMGVCRVSL